MSRNRALAVLFLLVALTAGAIAAGNGASRALTLHEIFVAQTASEMMERGDLIVPHFMGEPRLQKPPLSYWLSIGAHTVLGDGGSQRVSELEARLPSLIAGLLLIVVTYGLGTAAFGDRRIGLVAATMFAASVGFFIYARSARPEMLYALFCTLLMLGLVLAVRRAAEGRTSGPAAGLAWSAMAGALFVKGLQFPIFFLAGATLALVMRKPRPKLAPILRPWMGLAILAPVVACFLLIALQFDGVEGFWAKQLVQHGPAPLWLRPLHFYYPMTFVASLMPWAIPLGLAAVACWRRRNDTAALLVVPILVSLLVLSFAGKLRFHYVLPLIPLAAVLAAWAVVEFHDRVLSDTALRRRAAWLAAAQAGIAAAMLVGIGWLAQRGNPESGLPVVADVLPWLAVSALCLAFAGVLLARRPAWAFGALSACMLVAWTGIARVGVDVSLRWSVLAGFATETARQVPEDQPLIFDFLPSLGTRASFAYYTGRRIHSGNHVSLWRAANPNRTPPHLICRQSCTGEGLGPEPRTVIERLVPGRTGRLILVRPSPAAPEG